VIRDPESAEPVSAFITVHERPFHLFVVGRTLEYFAHLHPGPAGPGAFEVAHDLPPGEYMLIADFLPREGSAQTLQRAIATPGYRGPLVPAPVELPEESPERTIDGVRVRLDTARLAAGKYAELTVIVTDASTGEPLRDLEPYLGAAAHMLIVSADLTQAIHGHPEAQAPGPSVRFAPLLPVGGSYKLWVQFQRKGRVVTVPFHIRVAGG
jgi:hypothetical protein